MPPRGCRATWPRTARIGRRYIAFTSRIHLSRMEETYFNEYHEKQSLALEQEVAEMQKHPYSYEQALEQVESIRRESRVEKERKKGRRD